MDDEKCEDKGDEDMQKKFLCALLIGCCVLGLSACGKSEAEQAADYYENELGMDRDDAEELANAVYGDEEETKDTTESEAVVEIKATDEILAEEKFSNKIQICNTVYEFPVTVGELLESGELTIGGTDNEPDVNENSLVPEGGWKAFTIKGDGVDIQLSAINESTSMTELKNCLVKNSISIGDYTTCTNVFLGGGLKIGMPYSEFEKLFGEPDYIETSGGDTYYNYYDNMYYNRDLNMFRSSNGYSYNIMIDMDNACVSRINYEIGERTGAEYKECVLTADDCSVHYYMPNDLLYEDYRFQGRCIDVDGGKYFIYRESMNFYKPDYNITEELNNPYSIRFSDAIECTVNDDGSVFIINEKSGKTFGIYEGYYFANDYCLYIKLQMYEASESETENITDAAKQELLNLVKEIFSKGVTIE